MACDALQVLFNPVPERLGGLAPDVAEERRHVDMAVDLGPGSRRAFEIGVDLGALVVFEGVERIDT